MEALRHQIDSQQQAAASRVATIEEGVRIWITADPKLLKREGIIKLAKKQGMQLDPWYVPFIEQRVKIITQMDTQGIPSGC